MQAKLDRMKRFLKNCGFTVLETPDAGGGLQVKHPLTGQTRLASNGRTANDSKTHSFSVPRRFGTGYEGVARRLSYVNVRTAETDTFTEPKVLWFFFEPVTGKWMYRRRNVRSNWFSKQYQEVEESYKNPRWKVLPQDLVDLLVANFEERQDSDWNMLWDMLEDREGVGDVD